MTRWVQGVLALLVLGLAGGFWLRWHDAEVRAGALLVQRDSVIAAKDAELAVQEILRVRREAEHEALRRDLAEANDLAAAANRRAAAHDSVLRRLSDSLGAQLAEGLPPELLAQLDAFRQTVQLRLGEKDGIIARQEQMLARQAVALRLTLEDKAACDSAVARLRSLADDYRAQRDAWRARAEPSIWQKLLAGLPWFGAGVATVAVPATVAVVMAQ